MVNVPELYRRLGWTGIGVGAGMYAVTVSLAATNEMPDWLRSCLIAPAMLLVIAGVSFKVGSRVLTVQAEADAKLAEAFRAELAALDRSLTARLEMAVCRLLADRPRYLGSARVVQSSAALDSATTVRVPVVANGAAVLDIEDARMIRRLDERLRGTDE